MSPSAASGTILFASDLTERCKGLQNSSTSDLVASHGPDGYRVVLKVGPGVELGTGPDEMQMSAAPSPDMRVELDAEKISGPDHNFFGIECRVVVERGTPVGSYQMGIGSDGQFAIEKWRSTEKVLASGRAVEAVRPGKNHIRADCVGTTLTLYVNGAKIAAVDDKEFAAGLYGGVYARSLDPAGAGILFTNLVLTKL
jgi:hypothetical protein